MKILLSWLRELVDVPVGVDDLVKRLSMRGFALEELQRLDGDAVIDLEVTANRPDGLSVLGIAREVATTYGLPLRVPGRDPLPHGDLERLETAPEAPGLRVTIEDPDLCPRYAAAVADVRVGPSPAWMAQRLHAAGVRPINNIVDVTNYVLLELGHPMHAFDLGRLGGGELRIRRARAGEIVRTLDDVERRLEPEMLVIADASRPQAVAGVMGGADSEVRPDTTVAAFESAYFKPTSVRQTGKRLGLKTEASARFERGANIEAPVLALERACALLRDIGAGTVRGGLVDRYPAPFRPRVVALRPARVERVVGCPIEPETIAAVLTALGFELEWRPANGAWDVRVPPWRVDVAAEIDLIEEVARHYGYDRVPERFPVLSAPPPPPDARIDRDHLVRKVLTAAGFSEALTFTFIDRAAAVLVSDPGELVPVANPLSEKFAVMRPSLVPGILDSLAHNVRREQHDVRLYEIGRRFTSRDGERRAVGFGVVGAGGAEHWSERRRPADFFDLKGAAEAVCLALGARPEFRPVRRHGFVPGRTAEIVIEGRPDAGAIGYVGQLQPSTVAARDVPVADAVYAGEIDLDAVAAVTTGLAEVRARPLPRYPSVVRDISILVDEALPAASVRGTIRAAAPETLVEIREFDRYSGKGIPEGATSLSLRLTFRAPDRTLTDAEVQQAVAGLVSALERHHGATLRGELT